MGRARWVWVVGLVGCGPSEPTATTESAAAQTTEDADGSSSETVEGPPIVFVPGTDIVGVSDCDPFEQDCGEGEKCVPYGSAGGSWDAFKCVPVLGDQAVGEPCLYAGIVEATDDCDAGSFCWEVGEDQLGVCRAFCLGDIVDPICPPLHNCVISGAGVPILCLPACHPLEQDCDEGTACFWTQVEFDCIFTTEQHAIGEPCGYINDCVGGAACMFAEVLPDCADSSCCSPFCSLGGGDAPCAELPGTSCLPFFGEDMALPGYEDVGICIAP